MSNQNNIFTTNDLVNHYHDQGLNGQIKIYFQKHDVKTHNSKLDKPYYIIKPLVVKVGEIFDDSPKYGVFLKQKHWNRMKLVCNEFWLLNIDDEKETFTNDQGLEVNFYNTSLKYISIPKLIDIICKKALEIHNIEEYKELDI